jgi:hypothetical protein
MGRYVVLGSLSEVVVPLLSSLSGGRREAWSKTAMCGLGEATGVKLGADPVVMVISERGKRSGVALPANGLLVGG